MTVIDWSQYPKPWCDIGPVFAAEAAAIAGKPTPNVQFRPDPLIIRRLRNALIDRQMTMKYAAKKIGYSYDTIKAWLSGKYLPRENTARDIAKFLEEIGEP